VVLKVLYIGIAGFLGTVVRYLLATTVDKGINSKFPFGTVVVNVVGCFLAGLLISLFRTRVQLSDTMTAVVMIGFLGGFTTFSAYALQTFTFFEAGESTLAFTNLVVSNLLGLLAVWAGYSIAGMLHGI
jgi:CrcB protein